MNKEVIVGCAILILLLSMVTIVKLLFQGQRNKIEYNYKRGRLDGMGMSATLTKDERRYRLNLLIAWIFLLFGIWYIIGWYSAKNKNYCPGLKKGKDDYKHMDISAGDLIEKSYYEP